LDHKTLLFAEEGRELKNHGNESSGSINSRGLFEWLREYQLPKKDSAPW